KNRGGISLCVPAGLGLLGSSDPPTSASGVSGTQCACYCAWQSPLHMGAVWKGTEDLSVEPLIEVAIKFGAGDAMSRQRFQYFLESLLQDQWLIPTISSIQDWFDAIDDLWLQGTFIDFTPTEVAVYSHWVLFLAAMISPDLPPENSFTSLSRPYGAPTQQEAAGSD
ncbi:hypothetical protein H1C71_035524, partial [Ictidomys tridecemlineatus]